MKDDSRNLCDINSEAGVIATLIHHPDFCFYSEHLLPNHFTNVDNQYIYRAIVMLAQKGITTIDTYNLYEILNSSDATKRYAEQLSIDKLNELIDNSTILERSSVEEYKMLVDNVLDYAFRRDAVARLDECRSLCFNENAEDIEHKIYELIDDVMIEYSANNDIPEFKDVVDEYWNEIESRQGTGYAGIPFKFKTLNEYCTMEKGELVIFGAEYKQGKSILLLNCAVDLLKQDKAVLYLDSELNSRLFTARLLAHLTGIEYKRLVSGVYTPDERDRIVEAKDWMKTRRFVHIYIPTYDTQSIYTTIKKIYHTMGIDVLVVDYFKGKGDAETAWDSYQDLGRFTDLIKNEVAGNLGIAAIGAAQATSTGKLADSAKIARNASTIVMLSDKTDTEKEVDGEECGNKKLIVTVNRNGPQMSAGQYIDMFFDGNHILYEEAKQHTPIDPY